MKRICSFLVAAVAMISAVSCNKELQQEVIPAGQNAKTFMASFQDGETKAVLNGTKTMWENNDAILVYDGIECVKYVTKLGEPAPAAKFVPADGEKEISGDKVIAVYPEWADGYRNGGAYLESRVLEPVWLEKNQQARAGSYDPRAAISMAYSEDSTFVFKNATSLLKFSVVNEGVKSVTFYSKGGEPITGLWTLGYNDGEPVAYPVVDEGAALNWVELSAGEGTFEVGKEYYISIFPQMLESGFAVEFSFDGNEKIEVKSYDTEITFVRNVIMNLGALEYTGPMPGWGIVGDINEWGEYGDYDVRMEEHSDSLFVAKSVYFASEGDFKIRRNNSWKNENANIGVARPTTVEADYVYDVVSGAGSSNMTIASGEYDIWLDLKASKVYVMTPGNDIANAFVPEIVMDTWYLVGGFNDWTVADETYVMEFNGDEYVYYGLTFDSAQELKFNAGSWDNERGGKSDYFAVNEDMNVWAGGGNLNVPAGTYDVYLSADASTVRFEGEISETPVVPTKSWYLVGTFNGWTAGDVEYLMSFDGEYYVFQDLTFDEQEEVKFNAGDWSENRGGKFEVNTEIKVAPDGPNMVVPAGTYDVYLSADASLVYFMNDGMTPDEAGQPEPAAFEWFLVGDFNGWATGDSDYGMVAEEDYYVFYGFESAGCQLKFNAGGWDNNRGGSFAEDSPVTAVSGGNNIVIPEGVYDIFLSKDTNTAWFMTPGSRP